LASPVAGVAIDVDADPPDGKGGIPGSLFRGLPPQPHFFTASLAVALNACLSLAFQDASRALAVDCVVEVDLGVDGVASTTEGIDKEGSASSCV
jgi:hypothetical protein